VSDVPNNDDRFTY
nr:RecName: Full=Phospholemman-like protein; AltName: Full=PLMS [Lamna nasus]